MMNQVTFNPQKDMELEQYVKDYIIFVDTCSLLDEKADIFWKHITPVLEKNDSHVVVPKRVVEEVQKCASNEAHCIQKNDGNVDKGKELFRLAIRAENRLGKLQAAGRVKIYGEKHDDFADSVFLTIFTQFRTRYNLLLITQDKNLTYDIRNLANQRAVQSRKQIAVKKLNKMGYLGEYRSTELEKTRPGMRSKQVKKSSAARKTETKTAGRPALRRAGAVVPGEKGRSLPDNEKFELTTQLTYEERLLPADEFPKEGDRVLAIRPEGRQYLYLTEQIGAGGEGIMYRTSRPGFVVKIYKKEKLNQDKFDKLMLMITRNIDHEGICFPLALICNGREQFVGYLMREAKGESLQKAVFLPQLLKKKHPDWKKIDTVNLCLSILDKIKYLHDRNVILGDINPGNILVDSPREVYFVDTDSYQVEGHPCPVGTIIFTAPEIQRREFSTFLRTMEQERFAVATLLFMIMLPGKPPYSHQGGEDQIDNILKGDFSYASGERSNKKAPEGMWRYIWSHLPRKLKDKFYETFRKDGLYNQPRHRLTDADWIKSFKEYKRLLENGFMAENDPMSLELFPSRLKKNPNATYVSCRLCGKEVDENYTKAGVCQECLDQGETYHCKICGKEMTYTNFQKYVKEAPKYEICYDCQQKRKEVFRRSRCSECGEYFELTYGEKEFYDLKGLSYPKKCKKCRTRHGGSYRTPSKQPYSGKSPRSAESPRTPSRCFITTAVCLSFGKADNCYELSTLRGFRDDWLSQSPGGEELIEEYYRVAPQIVNEIDRRSDRKEIYLSIYENYLTPCLQYIEEQKYEACRDLYRAMVYRLKNEYLLCSC